MGDIGPPIMPPRPAAARQPRAPPAHPLPPPRARRDGELPLAVYGHIELELVTGIALCCFLGTLLLCNITSTATMAVRRAFGRDSLAAAAVGTMLYFGVIALIAQIIKANHQRGIRAALIARAQQHLAGNVRRAPRRRQDPLIGPVTGGVYFVSCVFMFVGVLMMMLAPANSYQKTAGYLVAEIGWFTHSVTFCFIVCAAISAQWRSICAKLKND